MRILFIMVGVVCLPIMALARPVSYPGGVTLMQMNDANSHSVHLHYSPSAKYSIGYKASYWRDEDWQFHGAQLNYLVKRWNRPESQANLYLKSGAGVAYSDYQARSGDSELAAFTGIAADWEDRRYFVSYENHAMWAGDISTFAFQKARVGIAPYIGDYGDIHTWLMLEGEHNPEEEENFTVTPLVRFFKGVHLMEAGMSNHGDVLFNYVLRF